MSRYKTSIVAASTVVILILCSGCPREEPLPEWPLEAAKGSVEVVEAARPEGGAEGTLAVSDMTRPPVDGDVGWWPSLATAADGTVHVSYTDAYNGAIHHAERVDGEWKITLVDSHGAVGKYTALTLSGDGTPHVLYYNQDNRLLRHAMRADVDELDEDDRRRPPHAHEDWVYEVVDQGLEIGMAGRLMFGRDGILHAVYYGPSERVIHAYREPPEPGERGRWRRRIIDRDAAGSHSIVIGLGEDSEGGLHVSFSNWLVSSSHLKYGYLAPGASEWEVSKVEGVDDAGWKSGIVLDEQDRPLVAYLVLQKRQIRIARLEEDGWKHFPLVERANTMDISGAPDGPVVIAYEHLPGRGLRGAQVRYLMRDDSKGDLGKGWTSFSIPKGDMSTYLSLAMTAEAQPLIAFYRGDIRGLSVFAAGAVESAEVTEQLEAKESDDTAEGQTGEEESSAEDAAADEAAESSEQAE